MRGDFAKQAGQQAASLGALGQTLSTTGSRVQNLGRTIMGTSAQSALAFTKISAAVAGVAGAAGLGLAVQNGISFNRTMEDARLQVGTMFQMFEFGADAARVVSGEMTEWQYNIQLAEGSMSRLYDIAKQTPASFGNLITVYQSAAAGLATQTKDIGRHMEFMERAALLGGMTGGDYQVLGAQMGRIIAGSAGAEMNIWKIMQGPILEAGKRMKVFNKELGIGTDLTQQFNQLTGDARLEVMMEAMSKIGPEIAKSFGESMAGISSTTASAIESVTGRLTKPLYERFREWLVWLNQEGGLLGEESMVGFRGMADYFGERIADAASFMFDKMVSGAEYVRDNWDTILIRLQTAWDVAMQAAKVYAALAIARTGAGAGMMAGGAAMRGAGGVMQLGTQLAALGPLALLAAPAIAALVVSMAGLAAVAAGVGAYVVENWDEMMETLKKAWQEGRVTLEPVIVAAETLWGKLVAAGEALWGGSDAADTAQWAINLLAEGIDALTGATSSSIRGTAHLTQAMAYLEYAEAAVVWVGLKAVQGLIMLGRVLMSIVPYTDEAQASFKRIEEQFQDTIDAEFAHADAADAMAKRLYEVADAFDHAGARAHGMMQRLGERQLRAQDPLYAEYALGQEQARAAAAAAGWTDPLEEFKDDAMTLFRGMESEGALPEGAEKEKKAAHPRGPKVNIAHLEIHQDLRDTDPDRLMAAFVKPLERMADKRVQAWEVLEEGV